MATPTPSPAPAPHSVNVFLPPPSKPKPRTFILTDITPKSSAVESLTRYLLYANQFETEGLVACTSARNPDKVYAGEIERVLGVYGEVVKGLNAHAGEEVGGVGSGGFWPEVDGLRTVVRGGSEKYGLAALSDDEPLSPGAQLLLERIIKPLQRPLWILAWGGTNTLASVLYKIDNDYTPEDAARLLSRIRVYAISDQDDTGAWIRSNFPSVFWIGSVHGFGQYGMAAWTGISGEEHYGFDQGGPDPTKISREWIDDNIRLGPCSETYNPSSGNSSILEEATASFLYLVQNGLSQPETPEFGSWGGRYISTTPPSLTAGPPHPLSLGSNHYSDAVDTVYGRDGRAYTSNHATIWRWRSAIQNDFAARIQWTLNPFPAANHHPVITINGARGIAPVKIEAEAGSEVILDASKTSDPDGDGLMFKWWQYREPSCTSMAASGVGHIALADVGTLSISQVDGHATKVKVKVPGPEYCAVHPRTREPLAKGQTLHLVLEVMDDAVPALTSYRRVLILVGNRELRGRGGVREELKGKEEAVRMGDEKRENGDWDGHEDGEEEWHDAETDNGMGEGVRTPVGSGGHVGNGITGEEVGQEARSGIGSWGGDAGSGRGLVL